MPNAEVTYFFDRLRSLETTRPDNDAGDRWRGEDGADLTIEIASYLREALGVPALEAELAAASQIDRATLVKFTEGFAAIGTSDATAFAMTFPDGTTFDWQRPVGRLRELLESLRKPEELEEIEVGLRLSLISDSAFERLVMAIRVGHPFRDELEATLLAKLGFLSDEDALEFWARQRNEVDPSRD